MEVIKQNGGREQFNIEKIKRSIQKAAMDAGLPINAISTKTEQILEKIDAWSKKKVLIETKDIKKIVLKESDVVDKRIADAWRRFDQKFKN